MAETLQKNAVRKVILCSCEGTMSLDAATVKAGLGDATELTTATHLCGPEMAKFTTLVSQSGEASAGSGSGIIVCCTQEARLFRDMAEDEQLAAKLSFVNVRETAGWSTDGKSAGPKMAALIAAATVDTPPPPGVALESSGITLIIGRGQAAIDAAHALEDKLDITVLLLAADGAVPPSKTTFPVRLGRVRSAKGHLGAFELTIDGLAAPAPSSRAAYTFGPARDGAVSKADLVIDLTGAPPLFSAHDLRDGYLRADPADPLAVERVIAKAADLVGTFDKPRYIAFRADLCAHSRSRIVGCRRCLDVCPAGAITPNGDHVAIDPNICGGCGHCAAVCPTGAASYTLPAADVLVRRLRAALLAYRAAGGGANGTNAATILLHDGDHGAALIDAAARFGDGLPADVIPLEINETGQIGLETIAAAFAYGAAGVRILTRARPRHDTAALDQTLATATAILAALGYGRDIATRIAIDDPDDLASRLRASTTGTRSTTPSSFAPLGGKRDVLKLALRELHRAAHVPTATIALPPGAVFGRINVDTPGCTLCLSCVAACPTGALSDEKDHPALRFDESLCVQCGLCQGTCPEKVITLQPRLDFAAFEAGPIVLKEEDPFCCIACSKPFGVKSTVEKVVAKLGSHWMYQGEGASRLDLIRMCEDCRISVSMNEKLDPYNTPPRPLLRTTEDYFREREEAAAEAAAREKTMLEKIDKGEA